MKSLALNASVRVQSRRNANKQLRASGSIPAIIYGRHNPPQNLQVDAKELEELFHHSASENLLVDLTVKDDAKSRRLALVQEVQHHPLSGKVLHVDFHEVSENERVSVFIPVETTGEAVGVKLGGGVLEHVLFRVKVRGLPKDLPEQVVLDVSALEVDRAIHLGDIKLPEGVEVIGNKDLVVVACAQPRAEEVAEAVVAEGAEVSAAGDVEMLKEKKDEGAEAAPTAKGAAAPAAKGPAPKAGEKAAAPAAEKKK
jgi:large subunit ribosomal protein L25